MLLYPSLALILKLFLFGLLFVQHLSLNKVQHGHRETYCMDVVDLSIAIARTQPITFLMGGGSVQTYFLTNHFEMFNLGHNTRFNIIILFAQLKQATAWGNELKYHNLNSSI